MSGASLWNIQQALEDLEELRAQLIEENAPALDIEVADKVIAEWLERSPEKVTSYVGLIRSREATAAAAKLEEQRIRAIRKAAEADVDRLKANVLATMQRFDIKELKATPGGGFRRQNDGGLQALSVPDVKLIPVAMQIVTLRMPMQIWNDIRPREQSSANDGIQIKAIEANGDLIREVLEQRVVCPKCHGRKVIECYRDADEDCDNCKGHGTIPATVPGARLLPRGEQVRIFPKPAKEIE